MTIAVQKGHDALKQKLAALGYDVVTYGEYTGIIDALLYDSPVEDSGFSSGNFKQAAGPYDMPSGGILMLNVAGKSIDEIQMVLSRRLYSPLF